MLDNEAELSYVAAHEIAHVELRQAYLRIRDKNVEVELAKEKAEKEKMITDVATTVMGAGLGSALIPLAHGFTARRQRRTGHGNGSGPLLHSSAD